MGHIFISYSHKDKDYVEKLEKKLQDEGFEVWIDHDIDYGTQWPKEIQKALDACDAFIVVVSENAYASEWVQAEVARAKRKKKPFFPLLLKGDTWLTIEAIQYVNVKGKKLPPKDFFDRLGKVADRYVLPYSKNWYNYRSEKYHFKFGMPFGAIAQTAPSNLIGYTILSNSIRFDLPVLQGTNLREKYLWVSANSRIDAQENPSGINKASRTEYKEIDISNTIWLFEGGCESGMSKDADWVSYSAVRDGVSVEFVFILRSVARDAFAPIHVPLFDRNEESGIFSKIMTTFKWLEK